jgi:hypothetical protein
MLRAQYHLRHSERGLLAWSVRRLVALSTNLPIRKIEVASIAELDEDHWYSHGSAIPTCKSVVEHCSLIVDADLSYPIILDQAGRVMDGMHRVCKALMQGVGELPAVQFMQDPEPDYVGQSPETLPYGDA